jgi:mRNA interferase MazF
LKSIGDIHLVNIYYKGTSGPGKARPVLIINYQNNLGLYTIAEITSVPPKNPPGFFDICKEKIDGWRLAGLDGPSYVKCHANNIHRVKSHRLNRWIGNLGPNELLRIIQKITEVNL